MRQVAPYGSWRSPITAATLTEEAVRVGEPRSEGDVVYWLEGRPQEAGRSVVVRRDPDGTTTDVTPPGFNARTMVHEYGGAAYAVRDGVVFFANFEDQRLYRQDPGAGPVAITPEPEQPRALRYADLDFTPDGTIVCVRERHGDGEAVNELVMLPADGPAETRVLASGHDFYAAPRVGPDGTQLAWLTWDHPRMPWDGTELWVAPIGDGEVGEPVHVAGGPEESVTEPRWSPDGDLHFVSDRTGFWNLYRADAGGGMALAPMDADAGLPAWVFGTRWYDFLPDGRIVFARKADGLDRLALAAPGGVTELMWSPTFLGFWLVVGTDGVWAVTGDAERAMAVTRLDLDAGTVEIVRRSSAQEVPAGLVSPAEPIEFSGAGGLTAHAFFYPPANPDFTAPAGELPPLLVISHGGPTAGTTAELDLGIQFWTTRGIAIVDVNYGGSTGYGRAYRERLRGQWGVVDIVDCINAARHLADEGRVDGSRMAIRGGSAGGYTTLGALAFHDVFAGGASYYGVADLGALAEHTHKFESRYLDGLVGPYPEAEATYRDRSPLYHADGISCPVILFQGLEDAVVPPAQAEAMVASLERNGVPYAYLPFAEEQHGFRMAENQVRSREAELYFYGRIFGFEPADDIEPVEIANL